MRALIACDWGSTGPDLPPMQAEDGERNGAASVPYLAHAPGDGWEVCSYVPGERAVVLVTTTAAVIDAMQADPKRWAVIARSDDGVLPVAEEEAPAPRPGEELTDPREPIGEKPGEGEPIGEEPAEPVDLVSERRASLEEWFAERRLAAPVAEAETAEELALAVLGQFERVPGEPLSEKEIAERLQEVRGVRAAGQ